MKKFFKKKARKKAHHNDVLSVIYQLYSLVNRSKRRYRNDSSDEVFHPHFPSISCTFILLILV